MFLSKSNVVDYSLLLIINKRERWIWVGIIDYCQQYNLEKVIESKFKEVINAGKMPTIVNPETYKTWFEDQMKLYFIGVKSEENKEFVFFGK